MRAPTKFFSRQNGTGCPAHSRASVDYREIWKVSPPLSLYRLGDFSHSLCFPELKISLCRPCLVCNISVFTHRFVNLLEKRRRDHEAKKAAATAATAAEGGGQKNSSSITPSDVNRAGAYVRTLLQYTAVM